MNQNQNSNVCDICNLLLKTYNAFLVDKLPEDLKEACWTEASNCCKGDKCLKTDTKKVLMKLIENHKHKLNLKSQNIKGVFAVYWHSKYKKIVYILGENTNINQEYVNILLDNPIAFTDLYIKDSKLEELKLEEPKLEEPKLSQIHFTNKIIKPDNDFFTFLSEIKQNFTLLNEQEILQEHIEKLLSFCTKHESILQKFIEEDNIQFVNFWKSQIITDTFLKGVIEEISTFFTYEIMIEITKLKSVFFYIGTTILQLIKHGKMTPKTYLRITRMLISIELKINEILSDFYIMTDIFKKIDSLVERPNEAYNIMIYLPDSADFDKYQMFLETFGFTEIKK
jgi:hypothetical protein